MKEKILTTRCDKQRPNSVIPNHWSMIHGPRGFSSGPLRGPSIKTNYLPLLLIQKILRQSFCQFSTIGIIAFIFVAMVMYTLQLKLTAS